MDFSKVSFRPTAAQTEYLELLAQRLGATSVSDVMRLFLDECIKFNVGLYGKKEARHQPVRQHAVDRRETDDGIADMGVVQMQTISWLIQQDMRARYEAQVYALQQQVHQWYWQYQMLAAQTPQIPVERRNSTGFDPVQFFSEKKAELTGLRDMVRSLMQ